MVELLAHFPAYRIYTTQGYSAPDDLAMLARALQGARRTALKADRPVLDQLETWLSGTAGPLITAGLQSAALARFQQLSAPIAAKAVEDTAFYRYGRLLSRNDVGFDARRLPIRRRISTAACARASATFPTRCWRTATHDHKRGEDTRARLAVLSEIPDEWIAAVGAWLALSSGLRREVQEFDAPHCRDVLTLFQTLVGAWPLDLAPADAAGLRGGSRSAWRNGRKRRCARRSSTPTGRRPTKSYEGAARGFLAAIMTEARGAALRTQIAAFARKIGAAGAVNGLAQTLLKLTVPGVPDLYQGTEFWDLSLVDPDNRRPVDFKARREG